MEKQELAIIRLQALECLTLGDHSVLRQQSDIMCQHVISGTTMDVAYKRVFVFLQVSFYKINVLFYLNKLCFVIMYLF